MTRARDIANLVDANGDIVAGALDNVPASNDASALTTGTLDAARLPTEIVSSDTTPQLGGNLDLNSNSITGSGAINVSGSIQATGNAITVEDSGFNSRINLKNTGTGGTEFSLYSTMNSFAQGAETFMLYSANATGGIIKADKYGRVTMPYGLAVSVYLNTQHQHTSGATKVVNWSSGTGSGNAFPAIRQHNSFDFTNSRFIAPTAGMYLLSFKPDYGTTLTTGHYVSFGINGSVRSFDVIEDLPVYSNASANYPAYLYLNQNDYVEMYTHGTSYNLNAGGQQYHTWWYIIQLS
jgi:hypothetical protein